MMVGENLPTPRKGWRHWKRHLALYTCWDFFTALRRRGIGKKRSTKNRDLRVKTRITLIKTLLRAAALCRENTKLGGVLLVPKGFQRSGKDA